MESLYRRIGNGNAFCREVKVCSLDILMSNMLNAHSSLKTIQHKLLPRNLRWLDIVMVTNIYPKQKQRTPNLTSFTKLV